jgi:hypothetical protein
VLPEAESEPQAAAPTRTLRHPKHFFRLNHSPWGVVANAVRRCPRRRQLRHVCKLAEARQLEVRVWARSPQRVLARGLG